MNIIGITGKKFSGKDTVGNYLVEKYDYKQYAYATALKLAVKDIFEFTDEQLNTELKEVVDTRWNITPRRVLQYVGTDLFRNQSNVLFPDIGCDFWIKVLERKILKQLNENPDTKIVITDIRYKNEAELVKKLGGNIIKLNRDTNMTDNHTSETSIDEINIDYEINNNGTKIQLFNIIDALIKK